MHAYVDTYIEISKTHTYKHKYSLQYIANFTIKEWKQLQLISMSAVWYAYSPALKLVISNPPQFYCDFNPSNCSTVDEWTTQDAELSQVSWKGSKVERFPD